MKSNLKFSFKIFYFKSTFPYQVQLIMKKNQLNLVFLGLGYLFSAVSLLERKVTADGDTRINLEYEELCVNLWLLYSHLRYAKKVGTWSGYLCIAAFVNCVFSVGLCSPWDSCPPTKIRETYKVFWGMWRQNHHEEQGRFRTERAQRPPVGPFTFLPPSHLSSRLNEIHQSFPLHPMTIVKRLMGAMAMWYALGKVNVLI